MTDHKYLECRSCEGKKFVRITTSVVKISRGGKGELMHELVEPETSAYFCEKCRSLYIY